MFRAHQISIILSCATGRRSGHPSNTVTLTTLVSTSTSITRTSALISLMSTAYLPSHSHPDVRLIIPWPMFDVAHSKAFPIKLDTVRFRFSLACSRNEIRAALR
jgi:hypothetical protein